MWPPQRLAKQISEFSQYLEYNQQLFAELADATDIQIEQLRRLKENIDGLLGMFYRIFNGEEYDENSFEYWIKEYAQDAKHREV